MDTCLHYLHVGQWWIIHVNKTRVEECGPSKQVISSSRALQALYQKAGMVSQLSVPFHHSDPHSWLRKDGGPIWVTKLGKHRVHTPLVQWGQSHLTFPGWVSETHLQLVIILQISIVHFKKDIWEWNLESIQKLPKLKHTIWSILATRRQITLNPMSLKFIIALESILGFKIHHKKYFMVILKLLLPNTTLLENIPHF